MKKMLIFIGKFGVAALLVSLLLRSGKMDLSLLTKSLSYPQNWFLALSLFMSVIGLASLRWKLLLEIQSSQKFEFLYILKLTWIGLLFNTVLPGAVSGDIVKLVYARDIDPNISKTYLVTSVILDRVLGLFGLLAVMGVATLISYSELVNISSQLKALVHFNFLIFAGMLTLVTFMFFPKSIQTKLLQIIERLPLLGTPLSKTLATVWIIGAHPLVVLKTILISCLCHIGAITAFWTIASPFFSHPVEIQHAYTFIPLGLVSVAIPITPAGLGIGHHIFGKLFSFFGVTNGVSLFNFYFIGLVSVNSLGLIPYLFSGKRHSLTEAAQFEKTI